MKALFIIPEAYEGERWGGVTTYTLETAHEFLRFGHEVTVVTPGNAHSTRMHDGLRIVTLPQPLPGKGWKRWVWHVGWKLNPDVMHRVLWMVSVRSYVLEHAFDIVEAPEWGSSTLLIAKRRRPKIVVMLHRSWMQYVRENAYAIGAAEVVIDIFERFSIIRSDGIISPSAYMLRRYPLLVWFSRIVGKPVVCIPYGVGKPNGSHARPPFRFPYIVTVGRVEPAKGTDILIRAFLRVRRLIPRVHLVIVGEDTVDPGTGRSFRSSLQVMIDRKRASGYVHFVGKTPRRQVVTIVSESLLYVCPSVGENLSIALLEAVCSGKMVIGSNVGGTPEIIENGVNGIVFNNRSVNELAAALVKGARDRLFRQSCERAAVGLRDQYDIHALSVAKEELYRSMLPR